MTREWDRLPPPARVLVFAIPAAIFPLVTTEGNLFRYGLFTLIYALLALGLNIVVGFAGLLDLGYIAFFGCGAYLYAILASPQFGYHWQAGGGDPGGRDLVRRSWACSSGCPRAVCSATTSRS